MQKKRKKSSFLLGALFLALLIYVIWFVPPQGIAIFVSFFILLFLSVLFLVSFITKKLRWGILSGGGITIYMFVRFLELTHWMYPLLLITLAVTIELYFNKDKQPKNPNIPHK